MPAAGKAPDVDKYLSAVRASFGAVARAARKEQLAAAMPFIIDVREASEGQTSGSIEGSVSIPIRSLAKSLDKLPKDKISAKA